VLSSAVVAVSTLAVIAGRQSREAREQAGMVDEQSREARRQLARNNVSQGQALLIGGHPAQAPPYLRAAREASYAAPLASAVAGVRYSDTMLRK
jgi:hypothetical protein